jgi:N-carbamoylputrescine amidase
MKVALIQMRVTPDPDANLARAVAAIRDAAARGAELVCLPELFRTLYPAQTEDPALFALAEPIPGPTTATLSEVAREEELVIVASLFERRTEDQRGSSGEESRSDGDAAVHHNTVAVIDADGALRGIYRKMHIPYDPSYFERYYFTPGDLGFQAFDTRAGKIGAMVCWDQWYPEGARITAMKGAEILLYPTAIGWHPNEKHTAGPRNLDAWKTVQRAHAITNGCWVIAVNRVGLERADPTTEGVEFWGHSFVADPFGVVVAEAPEGEETTLVVDIDLAEVERTRAQWPFWRDRRADAYGGL